MNVNKSTMDEYVERLHACLADALRQTRPQPFAAPVTVAEIYQDLVPYRTVRGSIGFDMNADYEYTLLRLLSGEGDLAKLEPVAAARELQDELESPNPNVGLFRKFAGCEVWITPREGSIAPPAAAVVEEDDPIEAHGRPLRIEPRWAPDEVVEPDPVFDEFDEEDEDVEGQVLELHAQEVVEEPPAPRVRRAAEVLSTAGAAKCGFCERPLPSGRTVRYCPQCGADQSLRPCAACGEPLQLDWRFCVACGDEQPR